ncbi:hypothetical protein EC973_000976 [Apophysomyces ossiformis]|uniref:Uncharacterized protein n=1 Tax=Apophysomyces ossiformis TaxID=679940 RepID=A0A8H7BQV9_9FUNG|nr:hypothetical protein EC973_000976 [Apophysomyces ossiformis]
MTNENDPLLGYYHPFDHTQFKCTTTTPMDDFLIERKKCTSWTAESLNENDQQFKDELIQRATTRLRRRLLEEGLSDVMRELIRQQSQLEFLRVETAATIDAVTRLEDDFPTEADDDGSSTTESQRALDTKKQNLQLDVLERRLQTHKDQLGKIKRPETVPAKTNTAEPAPAKSSLTSLSALSMSRLSSLSLMSSLFSRSSSSNQSDSSSTLSMLSDTMSERSESNNLINNNNNNNNTDCDVSVNDPEEQQRRHRRRRRVRYHRQRYQERAKTGESLTELEWKSQISNNWQQQQQDDQLVYRLQDNDCKQHQPKSADPMMSAPTALSNHLERRNYYHRRYESMSSTETPLDAMSMSSAASTSSSLSNPHGLRDLPSVAQRLGNAAAAVASSARHPFSPATLSSNPSSPSPFLQDNFGEQPMYGDSGLETWLMRPGYEPSLTEEEERWITPRLQTAPAQRNVLEETLSFLDNLSEDGDDGGFGEDVYFLLRHPDLCCRPLEEIKDTIVQLRQKEDRQNPATWGQYGTKYTMALACTGWKWCKFLSILATAVTISLVNGPDDLRTPC